MSFFRYPGGKSKLLTTIIPKLTELQSDLDTYIEPFFGGGSVGIEFLSKCNGISTAILNDKDYGISCLWNSVLTSPNELKSMISDFIPSISAFDEFKRMLTSSPDANIKQLEYAFAKLAIHQLSYSGLGTKSGGPLGGRNNENVAGSATIKYPIDCRWSPKHIIKKIDAIHYQLEKYIITCANVSFEAVLNHSKSLVYLDPPYFIKGNDLYQHGFTEQNHIDLADSLKHSDHNWLLSYDDCDEIRQLYTWAKIETIESVKYSITASKSADGERKSTHKSELLISV